MKYIIRIYKGTLQYVCAIKVVSETMKTSEYSVTNQLYYESDFYKRISDNNGSIISSLIKDEKEVLIELFEHMVK